MRLGDPQHLALQQLWEARLRAEGLAVLRLAAEEIAQRRFQRRTPEEVDYVSDYFSGCLRYLEWGKFARGERRVWKAHAENGWGIRGLKQHLGIHSWKRVRRILEKHRKASGLVSPWDRFHSFRVLNSPRITEKALYVGLKNIRPTPPVAAMPKLSRVVARVPVSPPLAARTRFASSTSMSP